MTVGSKVREMTATLQAIEATLMSLSLQTNEKSARHALNEGALKTRTVLAEINKRLATLEVEEPQYKSE